MKDTFARNAKTQRASIEDLSTVGYELSDEHLEKASGGLPFVICASYEPASCLVGGGTDWRRFD
jgi:hypothetical protein